MDPTCDTMCSVVKKCQTMTEVHMDVETTDGYLFCLFCVGFTKKTQSDSEDLLCPAPAGLPNPEQGNGNRDLRGENDLKEMVNKLIPDSPGKDIEKTCQSIYLLHD